MVSLSEDLKELLSQFSEITQKSFNLLEENDKFKQMLKSTELQLKEKVTDSEKLMAEIEQKQEILDLVHKQLSVIPELKAVNEKQERSLVDLVSRLEIKDQEISRLKQKHLNDLNSLRLEIEDDRRKDREEENKKITELEEFYRHAQSAEVCSLVKRTEREKQLLMEQLAAKDREVSNLKSEHQEELEKLRIQSAAKAKEKQNSSSNVLNSEFYRKKILSMQEHYEQQIQELLDKQSSLSQKFVAPKETPGHSKANQRTFMSKEYLDRGETTITLDSPEKSTFSVPHPPTIPSGVKRKKVTFELDSSHTTTSSTAGGQNSVRGRDTVSRVNVQSEETSNTTTLGFSGGDMEPSSLNEDFWSNLEAENQDSLVASENNNKANNHHPALVPTFEKSKTNNRFRFSKKVVSSSSMYETDFGTFQVTSSKDKRQSGNMKRKLFTDPFGPQQL